MSQFTLNRAVTREECPWLDRDYGAGEQVYRYMGYTYGCIGPNGLAVSEEIDETPFFELPADDLSQTEAQP